MPLPLPAASRPGSGTARPEEITARLAPVVPAARSGAARTAWAARTVPARVPLARPAAAAPVAAAVPAADAVVPGAARVALARVVDLSARVGTVVSLAALLVVTGAVLGGTEDPPAPVPPVVVGR
jgi:hypothetical protein